MILRFKTGFMKELIKNMTYTKRLAILYIYIITYKILRQMTNKLVSHFFLVTLKSSDNTSMI